MENNKKYFIKLSGLTAIGLAIICTVFVLFTSCENDVLDTKPLTSFSDEVVWEDPALINAFISNTYRLLPHGFQLRSRRLFCLTDEAKARGSDAYTVINKGNATPSSMGPLDYWVGTSADPGYYKCITQCNIFLDRIGETDLDTALKDRLTGEAKVLRAYSYFRLISFYGGVPLITTPFLLTDNFNVPRDSYDDCMNFVIKELDEAINLLPLNYNAANQGRITKGAAMAVKSRALLYAASPLNNPGNDMNKWQKAADAAKAVIDLNKYALFSDYKNMFMVSESYNSEIIWSRPFNHGVSTEVYPIELSFYPNGHNGNGQIMVLHNIVEQYETLNGKLPKDDPNFDPQNPYINRDPRFYATILYDGAPFKGREIETFFPGGKDTNEGPLAPWNASITGYYLRKFIDESITNPDFVNRSDNPWPFIRYAEILLNYAEAKYYLNDEETCREYMNKVRSRPSVNMPIVNESGSALLEKLQNERFIELAFEEHRYFDARRWKTAPQVFNLPANGISIQKDLSSGKKTFTVVKIEDRGFNEKNYLAPIPISEINKASLLKQNPGY